MRRDELNRRRDLIVGLLFENGELSATELAERLAVSVQTIRTDLRDLDEAFLVHRRNGVARLRQQSENIGYSPRESVSNIEKQRLAIAVSGLVKDGARIALGTGTTVELCARMLATREKLFVATNSIHAVMALQFAPDAVVAMAGGAVRLRDLDVIGMASMEFFAGYRVEQAIFSCGGISEDGEILDYNNEEIAARDAIASCARETILVVDSTKFGRDLPCCKYNLWDYDKLVTTADLSCGILEKCAEAGCEVIAPTAMDRLPEPGVD